MKTKNKSNTFKDYLQKNLENKTFKEAFEHYEGILEIGLKVKALREKSGLTQVALAERLGVSQQVISRIESGEVNNPTVATLERIASATGYHLSLDFTPV